MIWSHLVLLVVNMYACCNWKIVDYNYAQMGRRTLVEAHSDSYMQNDYQILV